MVKEPTRSLILLPGKMAFFGVFCLIFQKMKRIQGKGPRNQSTLASKKTVFFCSSSANKWRRAPQAKICTSGPFSSKFFSTMLWIHPGCYQLVILGIIWFFFCVARTGGSRFVRVCLIWIPTLFKVPCKLISYLCNANLPAWFEFGWHKRIFTWYKFFRLNGRYLYFRKSMKCFKQRESAEMFVMESSGQFFGLPLDLSRGQSAWISGGSWLTFARRASYSWALAGVVFWPCLFCGWVFSRFVPT